MLSQSAPQWFKWFCVLGKYLSAITPLETQGKGLRVFVSVPTAEYVTFALSLGAMSATYKPRLIPESGDMVASWSHNNIGEYFFQINSPTHANVGGSKVKYPGWPVAFVPDGTPENRTARRIPQDERNSLQLISGVNPNAWYTWYAALSIHPVSIIGHKSNLLQQRNELREPSVNWLDKKGNQLLHTYSKQITNPNRFQFFPFSIFSPEITRNRPWLRKMESRLVICESFSAFEQMHPLYQQQNTRITIMDRRKDSSVKGLALINELSKILTKFEIKELNLVLKKSPPGVYTYFYLEDIKEDHGNIEMQDLEDFEL